jgi:hypothetical protein
MPLPSLNDAINVAIRHEDKISRRFDANTEVNAITNQRSKPVYSHSYQQQQQQQKQQPPNKRNYYNRQPNNYNNYPVCNYCQERGHTKYNCPNKKPYNKHPKGNAQ